MWDVVPPLLPKYWSFRHDCNGGFAHHAETCISISETVPARREWLTATRAKPASSLMKESTVPVTVGVRAVMLGSLF